MEITEKPSVLPLVSQLRESYPQFKGILSQPLTINLIVDTNVIISDLLWLTRKRKNENAVTHLLKVIQTKTITAYAPKDLDQEIVEKIPEISQKKNIQQEVLFDAWQTYKKYIKFIPYKNSEKLKKICSRDPKDAPFMALQLQYEYRIYSKDKDIAGMGGQVINVEVITDLKDYADHAEIAYSIKITGMGSVLLTASVVQVLIQVLAKIPKKFIAIMLAVFILLLINPSSRNYMFDLLEKAKSKIPDSVKAFIDFVASRVEQHEYSNKIAENKKEIVTKQFSGGEISAA